MKNRLTILMTMVTLISWSAMAGINPNVIEVDLDIDGIADPSHSCTTEVDPGGFVAVGGKSKKITLTSSVGDNASNPEVRLSWETNRIELVDTAGSVVVPDGVVGGTTVYKDYPANTPPFDLYVTGTVLSVSARDVPITLEALHSAPISDTVRFTVLEYVVDSVEWLYFVAEKPITTVNDYPDSTAAVGLKYYPCAPLPSSDWNDKVKVRVTIDPPSSGINVYLKDIDPDDPSANETGNSVDADRNGGDNRGTSSLGAASGTTDGSGHVTVEYTVSHQPGDNHRVAATVLDVSNLAVLNNNNVPPSNDQVGGFCGRLSDLLTVWRKLHVELDSMKTEPNTYPDKQPDVNQFIGESVAINSPVAGRSTIDTFGPTFAPVVDFYEGGVIERGGLNPVGPFRVISHTANSLFGDQIIVDAVLTPAQVDMVVDRLVTIRDDDGTDPQLPYYHDLTGFVREVYKKAYIWIEPIGASLNTTKEVPFTLNLTDWELRLGVGYDTGRDVTSTAKYWASLLVACYQGNKGGDMDPDFRDGVNNSIFPSARTTCDPDLEWGATVEDTENASVFWVENHRDMAQYPLHDHDLDHTIAHEIGHAGGPPSSDPDSEHAEEGIMEARGSSDFNSFTSKTLKRFRENDTW